MTKVRSRKKNASTEQLKKGKTVSSTNAVDEKDITEEVSKKETEQDVLIHEEIQNQLNKNENDEPFQDNKKGNEKEHSLRAKLHGFFRKEKVLPASYGRFLVLTVVIILTFASRFYNLKEPKHVW